MYGNKKVLAIVPARGGSKEVPKKNIRMLAGKPLIAYTIQEAKKSRYIDRVIVSTDGGEIAEVSKRYGAEVPFLRPKELAKDTSSSLSVILHALEYMEKEEGYFSDIIVFLPPTTPFRKVEHIDEGVEKIKEADAVVGVCKVREHPYFVFSKNKGFLVPYIKIKDRPLRRQDLPELYVINSSLSIAKREYYNTVKEQDPVAPIFKGRVKGVFMDEMSSIDIDSEFDFLLAEFVISSDL
jgi:N-acylneuraminate cytidylyltransferase/CMP-N,N'-diacetyllegionaminic acid synthase